MDLKEHFMSWRATEEAVSLNGRGSNTGVLGQIEPEAYAVVAALQPLSSVHCPTLTCQHYNTAVINYNITISYSTSNSACW